MASFIFNEGLRAIVTGGVDLDTDTFKMVLVAAALDETAKDNFDFRNDLTEITGTGYTAGGASVTLTVADDDDTNNDVEITCSAATWPTATISAAAGVVYAVKSGAASDIPIAHIDFGGTITSTADTFTATPSGSIKFQN